MNYGLRNLGDANFRLPFITGFPALMTSANFNEVQNENDLTDEGVKDDSISSTPGGKRPAPSAAEGGSSEDRVSLATAFSDCISALPHSPCSIMNCAGRKTCPKVAALKTFYLCVL